MRKKKVIVVGAGFGGLKATKTLARDSRFEVTLVDRNNHHLFQPLLFQVAMAGLNPADIAVPIRSLFCKQKNVKVLMDNVTSIDFENQELLCNQKNISFDYLVLACGSRQSYFGHDEWKKNAAGLKNLANAIEIRRQILSAFEQAEKESDPHKCKALMTFVVIGGGPTGVELAGAIAELSQFTLARDFREINSTHAKIILIEAGPRILSSFDSSLSSKAEKQLNKLGVEVRTNSEVKDVSDEGVLVEGELVKASCILWAAGNKAPSLNQKLDCNLDKSGRALVEKDLSLKKHPNIFVIGDQANFQLEDGSCLPALAPVALQQGNYVAKLIRHKIDGKTIGQFKYKDRGQLATIGRKFAIIEIGKIHLSGFLAWILWLVVHIYFLVDFKNRILVLIQWAWQYLSYSRGARLIVNQGAYPRDSAES